MNARTFLVMLAALPTGALAGTHVSTSQNGGTIRFIGAVAPTTSAYIVSESNRSVTLSQTKQMIPLSDARKKLSSDVLDYFATYAGKDAKFVSMSYN